MPHREDDDFDAARGCGRGVLIGLLSSVLLAAVIVGIMYLASG